MLLDRQRSPLREATIPTPEPGDEQVLLRVAACGVCRTDLHVLDGDLTDPKLPLVLGHEIVGTVARVGAKVDRFVEGTRVGVPWLGWTCGTCAFCASGRENLCDRARFHGYTLNGGYAEYVVADARYCFPLPETVDDAHAAPLLCAGLIGHRALRAAGGVETIGLYGFGAAAHIVAQIARAEGRRVFAFTRPGDVEKQEFARALGAEWAGGSDTPAPEPLGAAILFAPVGSLVPAALRAVDKGGTVVCAGIHMSEIPAFSYDILRQERVVRSVANLTRADGVEFFAQLSRTPVRTDIRIYPDTAANQALDDLREGRFAGAAVLVPRG